jgi:hypothetical protein
VSFIGREGGGGFDGDGCLWGASEDVRRGIKVAGVDTFPPVGPSYALLSSAQLCSTQENKE